jgi:hypothetical protein
MWKMFFWFLFLVTEGLGTLQPRIEYNLCRFSGTKAQLPYMFSQPGSLEV